MNEDYLQIYQTALKKARQQYFFRLAKGESGVLPALETVLKNAQISVEVLLGLKEIPLHKIKGTMYRSRAIMFSPSFLPLAREKTEFSGKWQNLCMYQLTEGIRDPIQVYEYLNWYYVVEGNKRVSVLTHYDAVSIMANVTRLVPRYDENNSIVVQYYNFLDFSRKTGLTQIWLSEIRHYPVLAEKFTQYDDDPGPYVSKARRFLKDLYEPFRQAYKKAGGGKLPLTTGDAFAEFLIIFDLKDALNTITNSVLITKFVKELSSRRVSESHEVENHPDEIIKSSNFNLWTHNTKTIKASFIYHGDPGKDSWTLAHEKGRVMMSDNIGSQVESSFFSNVSAGSDCENILRQEAEKGQNIIFMTNPAFLETSLKVALDYPDTRFFNCSARRSFRSVMTYFGRIHESQFLIGLIAGSLSRKDHIVAYGEVYADNKSSWNAFALGVKYVNPHASVSILPLSQGYDPEKIRDIDIVYLDNFSIHKGDGPRTGIYRIPDTAKEISKQNIEFLASAEWVWGTFYERCVRQYQNGMWTDQRWKRDQIKLVNLWWGMDSGMVDIFYSGDRVPPETRKLVEFMKSMIIKREFTLFEGPLKDNKGEVRINENERIGYNEIVWMDWFLDNIKGV